MNFKQPRTPPHDQIQCYGLPFLSTDSDMNTVQTIGENLSRIRKKHDLSQMQVAEFLGIKRELVSYYETGTRNIPLPHVHKLCDLFGISPINLLEGNESELTVEMSLNKMETKDLKAIASFKKIVMNYILLSKINDKTSGRSHKTHKHTMESSIQESNGFTYEQEVLTNKQLRKDTDDIIQRIKDLPSSRERSLAITKLQEGVMWLGMDLKRLGEANPYPSSKDVSTGTKIEPTADGLKL